MTYAKSESLDTEDRVQVFFLATVAAVAALSLPAYAAIWLTSLLVGFHVLPVGHFSFAIGMELFASHPALVRHWPVAQRGYIFPLLAEIVTIAILAGAVWLVLWILRIPLNLNTDSGVFVHP